jgi:hypothetical protein
VLWTNNWGIKKSFLRSHFSADEARQILSDHRAAHMHIGRLCGLPVVEELGGLGPFATPLQAPFIRYIPEHCGMQYHHPGSLVMLWFYSRTGELRENLQRVELEKPIELPESLAWAKDFVARYRELLQRLAVARAGHVTAP